MPVAGGNKSKFSTGAIAGIAAAAGGLLVIALILTGLFAFRQKRRNQKLKVQTNPFGKHKYTSLHCNFYYDIGITIEQSVMN
jgi:uncharacterized iron-regulated membrane protein